VVREKNRGPAESRSASRPHSPTREMVFMQQVWPIVQYLYAVWHVVWIRFCRWLLKYRSLKPASRYTWSLNATTTLAL